MAEKTLYRKLKPYIEWQTIQWLKEKEEIWSRISNDRQYNGKKKGEIWSLTSNDIQYNGKKKKGKYEALHRMTDNTMVKRKRRNEGRCLKPYIEWQKIQWLKEKGEIWGLTSNDRQYNGKSKKEKPKGKSEALHRMTDNTMVKRKKEKPKGKCETLHRMTDNTMAIKKGETNGEVWSLTSNDRQYNG